MGNCNNRYVLPSILLDDIIFLLSKIIYQYMNGQEDGKEAVIDSLDFISHSIIINYIVDMYV